MLFNHKAIIQFTAVVSFIFINIVSAQDATITITAYDGESLEVYMTNSVPIAGFQMDFNSTLEDFSIGNVSGGSAATAGFMTTGGGVTVLGFSLTGATIPAGEGPLFYVEVLFSGDEGSFQVEDIILSDAGGTSLDVEIGPAFEIGDSDDEPHFVVDIESTGVNQLVIFQETITGLEPGDEIGVFDANGLLSYGDCSSEFGEILVGTGEWTGEQLNLVAIGSVDNCGFGGIQLPGWMDNNALLIKVWKADAEMEYEAEAEYSAGSGNFGDIILAISELNFEGGETFGCHDADACNYDPSADLPCEDCCEYPEDFGWCDCDGNFEDCAGDCGGEAVEDDCGICDGDNDDMDDCGVCFGNNEDMDCAGECFGDAIENECGCVGGSTGNEDDFCYGCTDSEAVNYDPDATIDDGSCEYESGDNYLGFGEVGDSSFEIVVENSEAIGGFQFSIEGVEISDASGGLAEENGFMISVGGTTVLGFSLTGGTIPPGEGVLVHVDYSGSGEICLDGVILSTSAGESMDVIVGDCASTPDEDVYGCMDASACNYNPDATIDDGSCWHPEDEGWCDCDGNFEDCAGECGGDAIEDDCGVCDGDNEDMDCAGECFGEAYENECGCVGGATGNEDDFCYGCTDPEAVNYDPDATIDDGSCEYETGDNYLGFGELGEYTIEILVANSEPIGGFQFDVTGIELLDAGGGLAEENGFMISIGGQTVIGFTLTMNPIPTGEGVLLDVTYSGSGEICLENVILSTVEGTSMDVTIGDCISTGEEEDCAGVPGGDAFENECGCVGGSTGLEPDFCYGCTNPEAVNYDPEATIDDGSCEYAESYEGIIVINEINYNPAQSYGQSDIDYEFIELYNNSDESILLDGFHLTSQNIDFVIDDDIWISHGGYLVIARNSDTYPGSIQWIGGRLENNTDFLDLKDNYGLDVDFVQYDDGPPWPTEPDAGGSTLELLSPDLDNNLAESWQASYVIPGGTPGEPNSSAPEDIYGCTDESACNYNPDATEDDGTCWHPEDENWCDCDEHVEDCAGDCGGEAYENECGCVGGGTGNEDDFCYGCTDPDGVNYDPDATIDDGSCEYETGENYLGFGDVGESSFEVFVENSEAIGGFQFDITGVEITDAWGGLAEENGFMVSVGGNRVLGFSLTGESIPPGSGILVNLDYTGSGEICIEGAILSTSEGEAMDVIVGDCASTPDEDTYGCTDETACNYDPESTLDDDSCWYPEDEGWCDCDGNFEDCAGECGGDAIEDDCGVCDGNNENMDCAGECFGEAYENECGCVGGGTGNEDDFCYGCTDPEAANYDPDATIDDGSCEYDDEAHFVVDLDQTGVNQLVIFQETITSLEPGDEIGIFDSNGLLSDGDCSNEYGELLVGAGEWTGEQLNLVGIGSIDNCSFGGTQLPGWVNGNSVVIKVWKSAEGMEYSATAEYSAGSGTFGDILLAVSELTIGGEDVFGCTDPEAENYNPDATMDDGSCIYEGSGTIGDEGGTVEDGDGSVDIPPGALDEDVEVGVEETDESDLPDAPEDLELNGQVFAFTPHGQEFAESVTISIPYEDDAETLTILTLENEEDTEWEPLEGGTFEDGTATFEVNHFSFYGVGYEVDCLGVPDGDAEYDECDVCDGPGPLTWYADVDGDGLGDPDVSIESCEQPVGYVDNSDDSEPDCATNDTDLCGECGGDNSSCSGCMDTEAFNFDPDAVFDDGSCVYLPEEFEFSQSTLQAFYFVTSAGIDGESLEWGDWIGIYNGDVVAGARYWEGPYTTVSAMGDDGADYTDGYFQPGDIPSFRVYDASAGEVYIAVASENIAWENNGLFNLEVNVFSDCNGDPGGTAYTDDCDECVGGNTGNDENWAIDCNGDCFGDAFNDDCEECVGGNTGHDENYAMDCDDICFGDAFYDDCEECVGGTTGQDENWAMDCNDTCFGEAFESDCGCVGGSTGLEEDFCFGCTDESAWNCPDCLEGNPDASLDDGSCIYTPDGFEFSQSTMQAFHFFLAATLDDVPLVEMEDWIGIYNGDVCVGSWPWKGEYTTVPSMGDDGSDWTEGYMTPGVLPSYKVYDSSEGEFYNAIPSQEYPWANNEFFTIDLLEGMTFATYAIDLHTGANLISFYALPDDASLSNVFADLGTNITGVIGEGIAAQQISPGVWVGSLEFIDPTSGYWAKMEGPDVLNGTGIPTDPNVVYELHTGANLISFPFAGAIEIGAGIPDDVEPLFDGIIGEGIAAQQVSPFNWVGSLVYWEGLDGYWAKVDEPLSFSFNPPTFGRVDDEIAEVERYPSGFEYNQSTEQAFYFVENLDVTSHPELDELWLLAYCGETLVGAREWQGTYTDIPAMGDDGSPETAGYCKVGEIPRFKILTNNSQQPIALTGNVSLWGNNELFTVTSLTITLELPSLYALHPAYPNPFNPQTTISYELPGESSVSVMVFDINGRIVSELVHSGSMQTAGRHTVIWNAEELSTGVYFVKMIVNGQSEFIQKLLLIK